jgi:predicted membrane protein
MDSKRSFRIGGQLVFGIAAILFGVVFLLDNMDLIDGRQYVRFWPLFLIAFGVIRLMQPRAGGSGRFVGSMFILVGAILLLRTLGMTELGFRDFWPLILVLIGGSLIWGSASRSRAQTSDGPPGDASSTVSGFAVLGAFQRSMNTQDFRGGELTAIMGGCELDLRQAAIKGDEAVINTFAVWGGIKIKVPHTWSVSLQGIPILAGFEDKTGQPAAPGGKQLVIKGTAVMGGVEITN